MNENAQIVTSTMLRYKKRRFDFEEFIRELQAYRNNPENANHDLLVPQRYENNDTGYKLGRKVCDIRSGNINTTPEQKEILDEMGFVFDARENDFVRFMEELLIYKYFNEENTNHDLLVPAKYENPETCYKLGQKVSNIRSRNTTPERKKRLDEIGFVWGVTNKFDFDEFVRELEVYRNSPENKNHDLLVPQMYENPETGYKLGLKVSGIRCGNINTTPEQKEMLDEIGFVWGHTKKFDFEEFVRELEIYKNNSENANHDLLVPQKYENLETGYKLGLKVNGMRSRKVKTTDEQKERLDEIGFIWNAKEYKKSLKEQKTEYTRDKSK